MSEEKNPIEESQEGKGPATPAVDHSVSPETEAPKKKRSFKPIRKVFLWFVGIMFLGVLGFMVYLSFTLPPLTLIENPQSDLSTQLISADGVTLSRYYSRENRVNVSLNEISPWVVDALIATEDVRFYRHNGIDPKSFFSILWSVITGNEVRGGSTITMQLARNLYDEVGNQSLYIRKIKEYLVSAVIERRFTKQEVMEAYLNTVNIYGNSYGIETTARRLFDKPAKDLTIEESAMVVGMLKGQGVFNPFRNPDTTLSRRNTVINQMVKYQILDPAVYNVDSLKGIPLHISLTSQEGDHIKGLAPYFREYVRSWLNVWSKENGYNLYTDGLKVYTTLDSRMQAHAEAAMREHLTALQKDFDRIEKRGERLYRQDPQVIEDWIKRSDRWRLGKQAGKSEAEIRAEFNTKVPMKVFSWKGEIDTTMTPRDSVKYYLRYLETGIMSMDPTNGHIRAWVGGIDYKYFKYDHVYKGKRQVGSTFKPFVYGTFLEAGYDPCHVELNQPVVFDNPGGGRWVPKNSDGSIGGKMTLKTALANSVNIITARLMKQVGPDAVVNFAHKAGLQSSIDRVPAICLGTPDLSVMELTNAYSTFANLGTKFEPVVITRIEDRSGNVLWTNPSTSKEVMQPLKAYQLVELLKGVIDYGTGQRLRFRYKFKNDIAGKTGTTQNQSDGWFMGMTPQLVTGVWVGCSDRRVHFRSIAYGQGANMALPIWALYMKRVSGDTRLNLMQPTFPKPEGITGSIGCRSISRQEEVDEEEPSVDDFDSFE